MRYECAELPGLRHIKSFEMLSFAMDRIKNAMKAIKFMRFVLDQSRNGLLFSIPIRTGWAAMVQERESASETKSWLLLLQNSTPISV